jgi:hypothetical protein
VPAWGLRKCRQWRHGQPEGFCLDAIRFLDLWLKPLDIGFEWGSGRSTLWLAKRIKHLTTIEHDPRRLGEIQSQLHARGLDHKVTTCLTLPTNPAATPDSQYVCAIDTVADRSLDLCLVGGPSRAHCCLASVLKLKSGGLLILRHADRYLNHEGGLATKEEVWEHVVWSLGPWRQMWASDGPSETAIFIKP